MMLLDKDQIMRQSNLEGFWYSEREPHFPMPVHSDIPHPNKEEILKAYDDLIEAEMEYGPSNEWKNSKVVGYRGFSYCRCCTKEQQFNGATSTILVDMGCREYSYNGWTWPQGYRHYIDVHNVVPSKSFLKDVLSLDINRIKD